MGASYGDRVWQSVRLWFCWFTEWASDRIGRIGPGGDSETYTLPDPVSKPHGIIVGPDGALRPPWRPDRSPLVLAPHARYDVRLRSRTLAD
jgi:hypothetical protein